jgi:hypothetical protein
VLSAGAKEKGADVPATYEDANLIVQLLRWGTDLHLPEAVSALMADSYDADSATSDDPAVRSLLLFGETIGTLVKQDVLDRGLVLDLWWVEGMWNKVGPPALRLRERVGQPRLYENFEALAAGASS